MRLNLSVKEILVMSDSLVQVELPLSYANWKQRLFHTNTESTEFSLPLINLTAIESFESENKPKVVDSPNKISRFRSSFGRERRKKSLSESPGPEDRFHSSSSMESPRAEQIKRNSDPKIKRLDVSDDHKSIDIKRLKRSLDSSDTKKISPRLDEQSKSIDIRLKRSADPSDMKKISPRIDEQSNSPKSIDIRLKRSSDSADMKKISPRSDDPKSKKSLDPIDMKKVSRVDDSHKGIAINHHNIFTEIPDNSSPRELLDSPRKQIIMKERVSRSQSPSFKERVSRSQSPSVKEPVSRSQSPDSRNQKSEITAESNGFHEKTLKYSLNIMKNIYRNKFSHIDHKIYFCYINDLAVCFIISNIGESNRRGYMFDPYGHSEFTMSSDIKITKHLQQKYDRVKKIQPNLDIITSLLSYEDSHSFIPSLIEIGIIYCKSNQIDPFEMMDNKEHDTSKYFEDFRSVMSIPYSDEKSINDIFYGIKIKYYSAVSMSSGDIRQYIGNSRCIIIFKENEDPIDLTQIDKLGVVCNYFIVIEPVTPTNTFDDYDSKQEKLYRLGYCQRVHNQTLIPKSIVPKTPNDAVFSGDDLKNIILTKFTSCMINDRVSHMYLLPRKIAFNEFITKYGSK